MPPRCFTEPSVTTFTAQRHVRQWQKLTRRSVKAASISWHAHKDYLLFSQCSTQGGKNKKFSYSCSWWTCKNPTPAMVWCVLLHTSAIVPTHHSAHPVPFWKDEGGRWSIIITRLTQWLRWWVVPSMFELNSIKLNGNSIVIASKLWIRNPRSQPTPPVQFCLSLREKSPWYQCSAGAHPCTQSWYCRTMELAGAKPVIVHFVCSSELATKFR